MTVNNQFNESSEQKSIKAYRPPYQDDEIDLRELVKVIWGYKWLTFIMCSVAIVSAIFYALNAQEWWVAKGKVLEPQLNDVAALYSQSKKIGAILNASSEKGDKNEIKDFIALFEPETLFQTFINSFNSSLHKKEFLEKNNVFLDYLISQEVKAPTDELTAENQLLRAAYRNVLNDWMKEISASYNKTTGEVVLSFRTPTKKSSAQLLNHYILFINDAVKKNQLEQFFLFVDSSKQELLVSIEISKKRTERELALLVKKTEYAYQIALKAEIVDYQKNLNLNNELFQISLGEKALKAKMEVLKSITDLSILEPSILERQITLDSLNHFKFVDDHSFAPFRYLEVVEPPLARAAPKRALIVILATLLAGMFSVFIALVHYFMTKKED